ncbi:hypothetical protein AAEX28_11820 [Lentisphaerota bacterium WC36G]|nr:hypothetical protein LJT99_14655 [Lentisphaerae bacterium WC36]
MELKCKHCHQELYIDDKYSEATFNCPVCDVENSLDHANEAPPRKPMKISFAQTNEEPQSAAPQEENDNFIKQENDSQIEESTTLTQQTSFSEPPKNYKKSIIIATSTIGLAAILFSFLLLFSKTSTREVVTVENDKKLSAEIIEKDDNFSKDKKDTTKKAKEKDDIYKKALNSKNPIKGAFGIKLGAKFEIGTEEKVQTMQNGTKFYKVAVAKPFRSFSDYYIEITEKKTANIFYQSGGKF